MFVMIIMPLSSWPAVQDPEDEDTMILQNMCYLLVNTL